ncbi:protoporphyrinogen/coproporphyrinogen oxidase [Rugamonas sp. CCM 8940]|uniref:protoporphyrinogen/coproporphyrinogen oxidase n=1 Tax=Rugamonas sp. CCM 8940 TaxID=2765359 RepID=UPI0018F3F026|nr:FAD-dependent oxidoreductase [Rugamonas sp. CCM 8940]MBJ7312903.1 FAD-dependent oxidoreductase [Rugamonas sp. CCM 8940]
MERSVIVIGAGIAGLSAAHHLTRHGCQVTVLEAAGRVGGRMSTDLRDGYRIDRGAQFLSTGYVEIQALIARMGMAAQLSTCAQWGGTARAGKVRRVSPKKPWSVASSGLLGWAALLRLGLAGALDARRSRHLPLNDYAAWQQWDDQGTATWASERFGADALEHIFEPMLQGCYFQSPEASSRALALLTWSYGMRRFRTAALDGGMGGLTEALAAQLDVRLATPALHLAHDAAGVRVETPQGELRADHVILATTASAAAALYHTDCALTKALLATRYSATINIGIALPGGIRGGSVPDDIYGLLIPRRARKVIAAVGIESRKSSSLVPQGELLNVTLDGQAGARLVDQGEAAVLNEVFPELELYFPGVRKNTAFAHLCRWREAGPCSAVGRARAIGAYRAALKPDQRVLLAGDYMSAPTIEGAAFSGKWAASTLLAS